MSGYIIEKSGLQEGDMERINAFTRRKFAESEVYSFSLVLCDNEVDRDFDRFSLAALQQMQALFVGKTCIFDHERKSANQTARIFHTEIQTESRQTEWGEPYTKLVARAYLPITEKSKDMVTAIESGILKEVSVSCAVKSSRCSVCEKNTCSHRKGESYQGKLCHQIFEEITDAYECSFVAVPAQRAAGVTKQFAFEEVRNMQEILKQIQTGEAFLAEKETVQKLAAYVKELEEKAQWGEEYKADLSRQIMKYSALVQPEMPRAVLEKAIEQMSVQDLKTMAAAYGKMAEKILPIQPQLWRGANQPEKQQDNEFKI
ncbi:hypothetical protein [Scatolibacter rhodanostii]|uniref:hypothetical protein n=1 Tax=Scatolibacter rhodanostii TaxID=2014781 RepID=UPI000C088CE1|nr:hypothetical protein [Scatolibacter rhodanostii]